jgi:hypothetical protein
MVTINNEKEIFFCAENRIHLSKKTFKQDYRINTIYTRSQFKGYLSFLVPMLHVGIMPYGFSRWSMGDRQPRTSDLLRLKMIPADAFSIYYALIRYYLTI